MKRLVSIVVLVLALFVTPLASAATLVTAWGKPDVQHQVWIAQDKLPSYRGKVVLVFSHYLSQKFSGYNGPVLAFTVGHVSDLGPTFPAAKSVQNYPAIVIDPTASAYTFVYSLGYDYKWALRDTFYHELGHVTDIKVMTDAQRNHILHIWGRPGKVDTWWDGEDAWVNHQAFPDCELFAENYRVGAEGLSLNLAPYLRDDMLVWRTDNEQWKENQVVHVIDSAFHAKYHPPKHKKPSSHGVSSGEVS